ncbi:MAG: universal stress protein [Gemmatimonadetes bacterium]|nr:universal stress protein [Gemmatimonadota bacterium]
MTRPIVVPLDGSDLANEALARAAVLARLLGASIHLVRVHVPVLAYSAAESPVAFPDPAWDTQIRDGAHKWLMKKAADTSADTKLTVTFEVRVGMPADEVVAAAGQRNAHAIVCTTHGHGGWAAQWLGSVADAIIRHSPCPVLAMSEQAISEPINLRHIMVPVVWKRDCRSDSSARAGTRHRCREYGGPLPRCRPAVGR